MKEGVVKQRFRRKFLKEWPEGYIFSLHGVFTSGIPDMLTVVEGRITFIEFKVNYGKLSKNQVVVIKRLREAGARVVVARLKNSQWFFDEEKGEVNAFIKGL